jgi:hypothetical protein
LERWPMGNFRTIDRQTGFLLPLARLPRPQTNEADAALFPLHGNHTASSQASRVWI